MAEQRRVILLAGLLISSLVCICDVKGEDGKINRDAVYVNPNGNVNDQYGARDGLNQNGQQAVAYQKPQYGGGGGVKTLGTGGEQGNNAGPAGRGQFDQPVRRLNPGLGNSPNRDQAHVVEKAPVRKPGPTPIKLAEHPACASDIKSLCSVSVATGNNFAVLDCLQGDKASEKDVSKGCQHLLWSYKKNLTTDIRFDSAAFTVCQDVLEKFPDCEGLQRGTGHVISCLIDHKDNVTQANCKQFLTKMASIVFGDYRLIYKFTDACQQDIQKLECGRLHFTNDEEDESPHTQGKTIVCLSENVKQLGSACKHEILRIAELQADDYHMDRPLFYACRDDRERLCQRVKAGGGKVFKCLSKHKNDDVMSDECRKKITLRQRLIQEDYKINRGFAEKCRDDIKRYKCMKGSNVPDTRQARLSYVLLCLEGVHREGESITPECMAEVVDMRRSLMEDYAISPDLVAACGNEISTHCDGGLQREGKTLHCLMDLARPKFKGGDNRKYERLISSGCQRELENLLKIADVGEDYRMDPALQEACQPVVDIACKDIKPGDARVIGCLMEKIGTDKMLDVCEERLLEIQYFVSRDFKLSHKLYRKCAENAKNLCKDSD